MSAQSAAVQEFEEADAEPARPLDAPRPGRPEDIVRMMDEAAARAGARRTAPGNSATRTWHRASLLLLWGGLAAVVGILTYLAYGAFGAAGAAVAAALGALAIGGLGVAGVGFQLFSPLALSGAARRSGAGARLAGAEMLDALGLAAQVLDAEPEARLVTRRDGVVVYANAAYLALAREAGIINRVGLPPRIDRLFAQQGQEATKLFRLCRAAKSAEPATEIVCQVIGLEGGGVRRRFETSVVPISGAPDHVVWRLRALPEEERGEDALAAAFADFPAPVFALERSGQIAWANAALRERLGVERPRALSDIVLGETGEILRTLLRADQATAKARLRGPGGDPVDGVFSAFRRGGVGEGFVCVTLGLEEARGEEEIIALSGDMLEAPVGVAVVEGEIGREARIVEANKAFADVFGGAKKNAPLIRCLPLTAIDEIAAEIRRKSSSGGAPRAVDAVIGEGASARAFAVYARPVRRRRGAYGVRRTLLYSVDVTDRKRMEADHAQDQKLKAIGRLAGEVAHDFNNVLQVVIGNCERLMLRHPAGDPAYLDLVRIRENAQRAANLTKQLLALSRKQTMRQEVLSVTEVLREFSHFLDRAVGEKVKIALDNGRGLPLVRVDRGQFETAVMNLAVNARDAMAPNGGTLTIRTRHVSEAEMAALAINGLAVQDHLLIEVADDGPGVPKEIRDKIFDPFFTTKEAGKGTGLGLSTVYGVIGQMEGAVILADDIEKGATFRIYLPAAQAETAAPAVDSAPPQTAANRDLTGAGRILVVEDEDAVRTFVTNVLEDCGYEVTAASDGEEALEIIEAEDGRFDLVVSDVMMPIMDGPSFVKKAREESGLAAKVIFMSAYAETSAREQLSQAPGAGYIQKPFSLKGLAAKVKDALTAPAA